MNRLTLYRWLGVQESFDAEATFVTSPILSPLALAVVRLTLAFYTFFTLVFDLVWYGVRLHAADTFFSYFTLLSYIGLCAYLFASGVQTLTYALSRGRKYPLRESWPRFLQFLHVLLFSTITTFPIIVTIVYWAALHPGNPFTDRYQVWANTSIHALNTVFAFFEMLCTHAGPAPWTHIPFLVVLLACYLGVAYITHATQGFYTYSFLDPKKEGPALAGWIIGIAAAAVVVFTITRTLCVLRRRLVRGRGAGDAVSVHVEAIDEWETVDIERPSPGRMTQDTGTSNETETEKTHTKTERDAI
ncbi:hypothetical protein M0805_009148 [Coniferiporia weirii]|nr:hypothetical protein M0805_009148 [Coniferiporia weirii]